MKPTHEQMALLAQGDLNDARSAGYSLSDALSAGCSLSAARSAGYLLGDARSAGYSLGDALSAGYSLSDALSAGYSLGDALSAGYSLTDALETAPKLEKPYTKLRDDIKAKHRKHNQSTFGPEHDPGRNLCGSQMCTAGHLVNMARAAGYKLKDKFGWSLAAAIIAEKAHPGWPQQNYGPIPQEWAIAFIESMADREAAEEAKS